MIAKAQSRRKVLPEEVTNQERNCSPADGGRHPLTFAFYSLTIRTEASLLWLLHVARRTCMTFL